MSTPPSPSRSCGGSWGMRSPPPPPPGSEPFLDVALPRARLRTSPRSDAAIAQSLQYEEAQACGLGAPAGDAALAAELQADAVHPEGVSAI